MPNYDASGNEKIVVKNATTDPANVQLRNSSGTSLVSATTTPGASDLGLVVRNIPSGTQEISGSLTDISGTISLPTGAATEATLAALSKAEDAAHSSGDKGIMSLAVRADSSGTLAGTDGDYAPLQVDANGYLRTRISSATTALFPAEDSAHFSGDQGVMALAVRNDALVAIAGTTGDYIPLTTDNTGRLWVSADVTAAVITSVTPGTGATNLGKAEDAAHASADVGVMALAVRSNTAASTSGTDGDYQPLITNTTGHLWTAAIQSGTWNITDISGTVSLPTGAATEATIAALSKAEDAAHSSGDKGIMALGVRNDAGTVLAGTTGDYIPLSMDSSGALRVTGGGGGTQYTEGDTDASITGSALLWEDTSDTLTPVNASKPLPVNVVAGSAAGTEYTEDAAAVANPQGPMSMAVRADALAGLTSADGDNVALRATDKGELYVKHVDTIPATQSGTWNITNVSGTVSLPTGAATSAKQDTIIGHVDGIETLLGTTNTNTGAIQTSVELIDDAIKADDAAFTPGTTKVMMAGFEYDDTTPDSVDEGDAGAARMSANRNQYIQIRDSAGNERGANVNASNQLSVSVDNTVTVASHAVTNAGTFAVQATLAAGATTIAKAEDVANADGDVGVPAMMVRKATPANLSDTDGDYEFLQGSAGRLWVSATIDAALPTGSNVIGALSANQSVNVAQINGVTTTMGNGASGTGVQRVTLASDSTGNIATIGTSVTPGTGATNLGKAEDAAHASADVGVMALAVRSNTAASTSGSDGDYQPLITNTTGHLWVDASGQTLTVAGSVAHDGADSGNPVKIGGKARTTNPTAVANADRADLFMDDVGRPVVLLNQCRDLTAVQSTTITASTSETTIVTAAGSGVFADLLSLTITNSSATALIVTLKDSTGGTTRAIYALAANGGITIPFPTPLAQASANNNWTLTCGTSVSSIYVSAQYAKNV